MFLWYTGHKQTCPMAGQTADRAEEVLARSGQAHANVWARRAAAGSDARRGIAHPAAAAHRGQNPHGCRGPASVVQCAGRAAGARARRHAALRCEMCSQSDAAAATAACADGPTGRLGIRSVRAVCSYSAAPSEHQRAPMERGHGGQGRACGCNHGRFAMHGTHV